MYKRYKVKFTSHTFHNHSRKWSTAVKTTVSGPKYLGFKHDTTAYDLWLLILDNGAKEPGLENNMMAK